MSRSAGPVVAIDGPAGAGKSTVARRLAEKLGVPYIDTGAMYRSIALCAARRGFKPPFGKEVIGCVDALQFSLLETGLEILLDGSPVGKEIRTPEVSHLASVISLVPEVRAALLERQRSLAASDGGVMEGRDIGTVVLLDADLKVFLTADSEARARRRCKQLEKQGVEVDFEEILADQKVRDQRDQNREQAPLVPAEGAWVLDCTDLCADEVVAAIMERATAL